MKRRHVLKALTGSCLGVGIAPEIFAVKMNSSFANTAGNTSVSGLSPALNLASNSLSVESNQSYLKDYIHKVQDFNSPHPDDIFIDEARYPIFESTVKRLRTLQRLVGYGNFNILSFADGLMLASRYSKVGAFTKTERNFMETLFYQEPRQYGFLGQKQLTEITDQVGKKYLIKVSYSGHYLYKASSVEIFEKMKKELGGQLILTSGVRSVMKQFLLFLNKAYSNNGNLSLASRSLAPPGYSFHSNGDFDIGQAGYGVLNFTRRFTETEVYKRLSELGYLQLRYPLDNSSGMRYEPWHIKTNVNV